MLAQQKILGDEGCRVAIKRRMKLSKFCKPGSSTAVRLTTMPDTEDSQNVVLQSEQNTIVAYTKPEGAGHVAMERPYIAAAGAREMEDPFEDPHCVGLVDLKDERPSWLHRAIQSGRTAFILA